MNFGGPFDKIKAMIQKMIFQLMGEQKDEDEHKLWCDGELEKSEESRAANIFCFGINFYTLVAPDGAYFGQYTSMMTVVGVQMNIIQDLVCAFYIVTCVYMAFCPVRGSPLDIRTDEEDKEKIKEEQMLEGAATKG